MRPLPYGLGWFVLSASYLLGAGDLMTSSFGREFVRAFVLGEAPLPEAAVGPQ